MEARPCPKARHNPHCVCRRFASEFYFFSFFPFVPFVIGDPCRNEARTALSTGARLLVFSMDHRIKSGGDE
jgi:hypothetical protein